MHGVPAALAFRLFCELTDVESTAVDVYRQSLDGAQL